MQSWPIALPSVLAAENGRARSAGTPAPNWKTDLPDDLPLLDFDAGALHTVLTELVNNAREATRNACTITFRARAHELTEVDCRGLLGAARPGRHVELTVADDGPGISPEHYARLFHELFVSTKPKHRGLGLLIVYGIMRRFHGGFRIAPPGDQGLKVQLYLPVAALERSTLLEGDSVLLVLPNPLLCESMQKILESNGCRVTVAASPQAGMTAHAAPGSAFSLIVTDLVLPQVSGLDFARRILERDPKASLLFIHMQSSLHGLLEEDLLKRFPVLRWPLDPQVFLRTVRNLLANAP